MNNCSCNALSCGQVNNTSCRNHCGCVLSDGTPACNAYAPWGSSTTCGCSRCGACNSSCNRWGCGNWGCNACGCAQGTACNVCGNSPCTCGSWNGCGASSGYLVPRYTSIGRTFQKQITQTLCVDGIPDYADSPLTLVGVTVCGQATWEQISECRQQLLRVTVPVAVQIRDCSGRCRTGHATVTLTIPLCGCTAQDFWRGQLYVAPCIRLAAPVTENEDGCFDATLEVNAEVYLVRLAAVSSTTSC